MFAHRNRIYAVGPTVEVDMHPGFWALGLVAVAIYAEMAIEAARTRRQDSRDAAVLGRVDSGTSSSRCTVADSSPLVLRRRPLTEPSVSDAPFEPEGSVLRAGERAG